MNDKENKVISYIDDVKFTATKLIDEKGTFFNSVLIKDALEKAYRSNLQLVLMKEPCDNETALCKIMDYNKWKYNAEKMKKKNEKKQSHKNKEMRFSTNIGLNDIKHKINKIKEMVDEGDNVTISLMVNLRNEKQKVQANQKIEEIMGLCNVFAKEVSRKPVENRIEIAIVKK